MRILVVVMMSLFLWQCKTVESGNDSAVKDLSDGSNWCHLRLTSTDATNISIDFEVYSDYQSGLHEAKPLWINVSKAGFNGSEGVHAVLIEKISDNGQEREGTIEKIDLTYNSNEQKYTGQVPSGMLLRSGSKNIVGQEFAFRVGGNWIKDPVSGESNFKSNLYDINKMNKFICRNPTSPLPTPIAVKDWRSLPSQQDIDQMVSQPINDPAHPYTDYRPDAPGANLDLPGQTILSAMQRSAQKYQTYSNGSAFGTMKSCLTTGYSPTHWPDIAIHYYCVMNEPRYCYTYSTSAKNSRVDSFKGCIGAWPGPGNFQYPQYVQSFEWVKNDQPLEFQYVMFGQTNAFKPEQEQAIINAFWGVQNAFDPNECRQKRPTRSEDPTDGTHCRPDKVYSVKLIGRSR